MNTYILLTEVICLFYVINIVNGYYPIKFDKHKEIKMAAKVVSVLSVMIFGCFVI